MIDVLDIVISNQESVSKELDIIYSSNMKQYRARFTFSDNSWDGYNKIVIFDRVKNYDTPIGLIVKDNVSELVEIVNDREFYCIIPWEILVQPGYFTISLYGTITDGEPKKKTIVINNKFTIQNSGNTTVYPRIPTPNIYEQLEKIDKAILTEAIAAKEIANEAANNVEIVFDRTINLHKNIQEVKREVEKKSNNYLFDTLQQFQLWIKEKSNRELLKPCDVFYIKEKEVSDYWWDGNTVQPFETRPSNIPELLVGQKTENGGEIFNDYENNKALSYFTSARGKGNIAGCRGFNILNLEESIEDTYLLRITNFDNIKKGDRFSLYSEKLGKNLDLCGEIVAVGAGPELLDIAVRGLPEELYPLSGNTQEYIWFPQKPEVNGDILLGTGAEANGYYTKAIMTGSHTEGYNTVAGGKYAHAEGNSTFAGYAAHAEGRKTEALAVDSHAEGNGTIVNGEVAHGEGYQTKAIGNKSHSEGDTTEAKGEGSHAEGNNTHAEGNYSHAEGTGTYATQSNAHTEGRLSKACAEAAHAEGNETVAIGVGAHSEGANTEANGAQSHSEGWQTTADGQQAHIEGRSSNLKGKIISSENSSEIKNAWKDSKFAYAKGTGAHVEGRDNLALGDFTHAEGRETIAEGYASHTAGYGTKAVGQAQTVVGQFNIPNGESYFIVGNGTDNNNPSTAFKVNHDGSAEIQTSGTNDSNVVNYKQLREYVSKNGKSPWDSQSEMLFKTGALKIVNHAPTSDFENEYNYGIYLDNNNSEKAEFTSHRLFLESRASEASTSLTNSSLVIKGHYLIPNISLKKTDGIDEPVISLEINTDGVTYNSKSITWDRLFEAVEKIENLTDVSVNGQ